ncbi:Spatacsin-C domain-containing protein [Nymphaea thermarum]|nr:Spatacsin-C domain-containing protein [Nymphaea thermarum]
MKELIDIVGMVMPLKREEGPVVLQLQRWDVGHLDLSQFSEASISPTRELLLLLSHQCEALFFPLTSIKSSKRSPQLSISAGSVFSSHPESVLHSGEDGSNVYPVISDVKSHAWGCSGDIYSSNSSSAFKDLLFVSGNHGVTVHAFCGLDQRNESTVSTSDSGSSNGKWVEWCKNNQNNETDEGDRDSNTEYSDSKSKSWLKTFFMDVETIQTEGNLVIKYPEKSTFPCSAEVVSFSLFKNASTLLRFLGKSTGALNREAKTIEDVIKEPVTDGVVSPRNLSESSEFDSSIQGNSLFQSLKCKYCRIFSSASNHLIGLVLTTIEPLLMDMNGSDMKSDSWISVVIAALYPWGIKCVCSVVLPVYCHNLRPEREWVDFQFSGNLLLCLNMKGLIFLWEATSGKLVTQVDILWRCGINLRPMAWLHEKEVSNHFDKFSPVRNGVKSQPCGDIEEGASVNKNENDTKREFRKLLVASNSMLLAAVDICGFVYVISTKECILQKYNELVPQFNDYNAGLFANWKIAGSDIYNGHSSCEQSATRRVHLPAYRADVSDVISLNPFGITRLIKNSEKSYSVTHASLQVASTMCDDSLCGMNFWSAASVNLEKDLSFNGQVIGCCFLGCLYLVAEGGLSVVLPSVSIPSDLTLELIRYWHPTVDSSCRHPTKDLLFIGSCRNQFQPWQMEVLDRTLVYEGPVEADRVCIENGWTVKVARMRRLQLALDYLKSDEIEKSLDALVAVNVPEEGILRLLFTAIQQSFAKFGRDNELAVVLRLLNVAARFATKMVHHYGLTAHERGDIVTSLPLNFRMVNFSPLTPELNETVTLKKLHEMAHLLEVIRDLQGRLSRKFRRPGQKMVNGEDVSGSNQLNPIADGVSLEGHNDVLFDTTDVQNKKELCPQSGQVDTALPNLDNLAVSPLESVVSSSDIFDSRNFREAFLHSQVDGNLRRQMLPLEPPKDTIARWEINNLDMKNIVKDALQSGRLPLAVLQLHLQHSKHMMQDQESHDTFDKVREVGRAIAYDLFCKGEVELAVEALGRLGEDIEVSLKQLLFGTVRKSLRAQIVDMTKKHTHLGPYELNALEQISLIERLYPSSNFGAAYAIRQKEVSNALIHATLPQGVRLQLTLSHACNGQSIECGEIDGVVLGSWPDANESSCHPVEEDNHHAFYWAGAVIWSDAWDQKTVDRIILDQPFLMGVHVLWESQLEYYICHNDWEEVLRLLDTIPAASLLVQDLHIQLNAPYFSSSVGHGRSLSDVDGPSDEELDEMSMTIPKIRIFKSLAGITCSLWLKMLVEIKLAKNFIFTRGYWEGTSEIIMLLACSGFISQNSISFTGLEHDGDEPEIGSWHSVNVLGDEAKLAIHKLVVRHCVHYNLPSLLDVYLDHHDLALDETSLSLMLDAAGECHWARWLLFRRVRGCEYDASFANARSIISRSFALGSNISDLELDGIIITVDDMAEGGGEIAALATLMHAQSPIQKCLCSGSISRHSRSSAQCTLENLRPGLLHFPTLWQTLVTSCFGQGFDGFASSPRARNVFGRSSLSDYLKWRENIFFSAGGDTSLLQILPCWFSKSMRKLVQLLVQGPLGWQSPSDALPKVESIVHRSTLHSDVKENAAVDAVSWEAAIQKSIEEELYTSSFQENEFGVEHHLHRGRALAAFNYLLGVRARKMRTTNSRQANIQSDAQALLSPLTPDEESLLASVIPLAILHFEDPVLVAACIFLLEMCGFFPTMLRVDIAVLQRISSFYKSKNYKEHQFTTKGSTFLVTPANGDSTVSLARTLADEYLHYNGLKQKAPIGQHPSHTLMAVLQHLEKASLPVMVDGPTCGSWLLSGMGDGADLRARQKAASHHWSLVTRFCQMHHLPISTRYLSMLAKDNDWVGFLTEAQIEGCPYDMVIQVATKDFSDPRLKSHILTVLRSMQPARTKVASGASSTLPEKNSDICMPPQNNVMIPAELFEILAECESKKNTGEALLQKAKDTRWSLLAMVASCFPDVSSLSCLTVWLEITAARETSSIKVDDISSQIARNVGAAVEATNSLPISSRALAFRYNRKNPKRRRLIEIITSEISPASVFYHSDTSDALKSSVPQEQEVPAEERNRQSEDDTQDECRPDHGIVSLSKMVSVLCEQHLFFPLLRAFEMFLPACPLLPFIRSLQAFSQMRLSEASAHLASFSTRNKESHHMNAMKDEKAGMWIASTAIKAADAMLSTCPSAYERRCLLQLLAAADFGDGGTAASRFRREHWKISLAEPFLSEGDGLYIGEEALDDAKLLTALESRGYWDQARSWAKQLESSSTQWKSAVHHVTETQAESMVAEWKEFLWDVPEERAALWGHCQSLFLRHSFPALQAGLFFLKHAEAVEKDVSAREVHQMLLLSLQWLSGSITRSQPVYPLHLLREIETRVWLLAVESEAQVKAGGGLAFLDPIQELSNGNSTNMIEHTANIISIMDDHLNATRLRSTERNDTRETSQHLRHGIALDQVSSGSPTKTKRKGKNYLTSRRTLADASDKINEPEDNPDPIYRGNFELFRSSQLQEENVKLEASVSGWEERVGPAELERAVLSLLEFGQITAAKQLHQKLSSTDVPQEFMFVDAALKLAASATPGCCHTSLSIVDQDVFSVMQSCNILSDVVADPLEVLEILTSHCTEGRGRGLCNRIIAVVKCANVLGLSFSEAFQKRPIELLQLLSLKAQDSLEEAKLLVQTHFMPPASIARILAESFLKARYMDCQKEEGPAPLLWRLSDFIKWAELCPAEPEVGHALMRLVITGHEIPHACEVELLILSHHFYKSSACLDGVDVLVALAATRVESYVAEGDFACLARLVTGVSNFHALNFILDILIENGQLELLLQKFSAAETTGAAEAVRGFRMAVLSSLKRFNSQDLDAFSMLYNHFDMKHETAKLLESRAMRSLHQWSTQYNKEQNEELLETMRYFIEAAEVFSTIDAGNKTQYFCAQASLVALQIRMSDFPLLGQSETNARRALVEQSRFQEALIVAEAYGLNQPSEWVLVLWDQMLKPDLIEEFMSEFVSTLPLPSSMLVELARFYRAEVMARGDQSHFSVWLSPGGMPVEWVRHLGRSFRCLLKHAWDFRLRLQMATIATGFGDVISACAKVLDRVPDTAGPLILRRGHGGNYVPLM